MTEQPLSPDMFENIEFPQRNIPGLNASRYRVYSNQQSFVVVEAGTIQEAMQKAGITNPLRVRRENIFLQNVLELPVPEETNGHKEIIPDIIEPLMVPENPNMPRQAVTSYEDSKPLSSDQVDQLLQSDAGSPQDSGANSQ